MAQQLLKPAALMAGTLYTAFFLTALIGLGFVAGYSSTFRIPATVTSVALGVVVMSTYKTVLARYVVDASKLAGDGELQQRLQELRNELSHVRERQTLLGESIALQLEGSLTAEQLLMGTAYRAAERSSLLARLLFVLGIAAPLAAFGVYCYSEPVFPGANEALAALASEPALITEIDADLVRRDWRVLLAGVSFGFLVLASAAGLLRDARQRVGVYFRFARRVAFIESCLLAYRLAQQRQVELGSAGPELMSTVDKLIARFIQGDPGYGDEGTAEADDESAAALRTLLDGLRRAG